MAIAILQHTIVLELICVTNYMRLLRFKDDRKYQIIFVLELRTVKPV